MFVAALLHLRPDLEEGLARLISLGPLFEDVDVDFAPHDDGVLTGATLCRQARRERGEEATGRSHRAGHGEHGSRGTGRESERRS